MTFNIRNGDADDGPNGWVSRRGLVARLIIEEAPQVIGIQEALVYQLEWLLEALPEYDSVGVARDDGIKEGEFCPILFRRELEFNGQGTFWLSDTPNIAGSQDWETACPRICTWVDLACNGQPFRVYNTHLDHLSVEARRKGLELVLSRARTYDGPCAIVGDLNAGEGELASYRIEFGDFQDTYRQIYPHDEEVNTYQAFDPTQTFGERIDYIFVNSKCRVQGAEIIRKTYLDRPLSDHFPVSALVVANV